MGKLRRFFLPILVAGSIGVATLVGPVSVFAQTPTNNGGGTNNTGNMMVTGAAKWSPQWVEMAFNFNRMYLLRNGLSVTGAAIPNTGANSSGGSNSGAANNGTVIGTSNANTAFVNRVQVFVNGLPAGRFNTTRIKAALSAYDAAVRASQADLQVAASALRGNTGFDVNGKIVDATRAAETVRVAGNAERASRVEIRHAMLELRAAFAELRNNVSAGSTSGVSGSSGTSSSGSGGTTK